MMKTSVCIGAFEIDDAELYGESPGDRTLTIPCKSDPDLRMQLDAWDADTSVLALLNGKHSVLSREHYDRKSNAWIMRLTWFKKNPSPDRLFLGQFPSSINILYTTGMALPFEDGMFTLVLFACYLDDGCKDIVVDVYKTEQQCLISMDDQRIRNGGCLLADDYIDSFWHSAQEYGDF